MKISLSNLMEESEFENKLKFVSSSLSLNYAPNKRIALLQYKSPYNSEPVDIALINTSYCEVQMISNGNVPREICEGVENFFLSQDKYKVFVNSTSLIE